MEIGIRIFVLLLDIGFGFGSYVLVLTAIAWVLDKLGRDRIRIEHQGFIIRGYRIYRS
jgi:hypothetical protein